MTAAQDYGLGPLVDPHYALLRHILRRRPRGWALEFGVGTGGSLRLIAEVMPAVGFDSFDGLPEDWRDGFPRGSFACEPPDRDSINGASLRIGPFAETLPQFVWPYPVGLVHIDCDLYSSTATVLEHLGPHLGAGCYVLFDEWHGYDGAEEHEQRAWREFADQTGIRWTVVGHSAQQWGIQIA
jgi:hypothetical protein